MNPLSIANLKNWLTPNLSRSDYLAAVLSGLLLALSFPPFNLSFFIWFALIPLLYVVEYKEHRRNFLRGLVCGVVYYSLTLYWLAHVTGGGAALLILFLSTILGGIFTIGGYLPDRWYRPVSFAFIWIVAEYLRSLGYFSFAWGFLGHSLYGWTWMLPITRLTGVYGLSLLIVLVNFLLLDLYHDYKRKAYDWQRYAPGGAVTGLWLVAWLLLISGGSAEPIGVRVAMLQGNFSIEQKNQHDTREAIDVYLDLASQAVNSSSEPLDLIILPESAFSEPINYSPGLIAPILEFVNKHDVEMLVGAVYGDYHGSAEWQFWNSAILFTPGVTVDASESPVDLSAFQRYSKMHLVPYGEWVPGGEYFPFKYIETLIEEAGAGIFQRGANQTVFELRNGAKFTVAICFESTLAGQVSRAKKMGADFLVNITNDAWFKRSPGLQQHFMQSIFRAAENHCPLVRAANTGITGIIDADGRVVGQIPDNVAGVCVGEL